VKKLTLQSLPKEKSVTGTKTKSEQNNQNARCSLKKSIQNTKQNFRLAILLLIEFKQ
jgi:uncharacterized membrane protein (UPF0182 family)